MTVVGKPSERQKEVYEVVLDAQLKALDAIRDGVKAGVINDVGRKVIEEGGYGKYFVHGIWHGLGLEVHEVPHLTEFKDMEMALQAGMVMTIDLQFIFQASLA
ncbi:MAG: M24 family metallopeptidase [Candidatus Zixiibacteriota bacterium]